MENGEIRYSSPINFSSKTQIIAPDLDINNSLHTSYQTILSRTQKWLGEAFTWITKSIDGEYNNGDKSDKEIVVTLDFKIYFFLTLIVCLCIKKYFLHELLVKLLHIDDKSS